MATSRTRTTGTRRASAAKASNVIEVDFEDYEPPRSEYMGEEPRKGVYRFKLSDVGLHTSGEGNKSIRWIFECVDEPYAGWLGFMYSGLPGSESFFRTQHTVRALQGGQEKNLRLDLDSPEKFIKGAKVVLGRVVMEEYDGDLRAKLRTVAPDDASVKSTRPAPDDEDDEDDYDEDADDFDEDEEGFDDEDDADDEADEDEDADADADEDEDEDEDSEDEEPEPAPRRRRTSATKAAPTRKAAPAKKAAPARRRRG